MKFLELDDLKKKQNGLILCKDAKKVGLSKTGFYDYVRSRNLEKVGPGIYFDKEFWKDSMYLYHLRFSQLIYSHTSALFLHNLTDREPLKYNITVKTGYNTSELKVEGFKVYTINEKLHNVGLIYMETPFGNLVPTYDMERTICDVVRSKNKMDIQIVVGALKEYVTRPDKNLKRLMTYAKIFKVEKLLFTYMEVLL